MKKMLSILLALLPCLSYSATKFIASDSSHLIEVDISRTTEILDVRLADVSSTTGTPLNVSCVSGCSGGSGTSNVSLVNQSITVALPVRITTTSDVNLVGQSITVAIPVRISPTVSVLIAPRSSFSFVTLTASASWQAQPLSSVAGSSNRILFYNQGSGVLQWFLDVTAGNPPAAFNGVALAVSGTPPQFDDVPVGSVLHWKSDASTTGLLINWY